MAFCKKKWEEIVVMLMEDVLRRVCVRGDGFICIEKMFVFVVGGGRGMFDVGKAEEGSALCRYKVPQI